MNKVKKYFLLVIYIVTFTFLLILDELGAECFAFPCFIFGVLIFTRISNMNALKPLGLFHGNGIKYMYQRKNNLQGYKRFIQRFECSLACIGVCSLIVISIYYICIKI